MHMLEGHIQITICLLMLLKFSDGLRLSKKDMLATLSILLDTIVDNGLL
jgi:hypothetical protein